MPALYHVLSLVMLGTRHGSDSALLFLQDRLENKRYNLKLLVLGNMKFRVWGSELEQGRRECSRRMR